MPFWFLTPLTVGYAGAVGGRAGYPGSHGVRGCPTERVHGLLGAQGVLRRGFPWEVWVNFFALQLKRWARLVWACLPLCREQWLIACSLLLLLLLLRRWRQDGGLLEWYAEMFALSTMSSDKGVEPVLLLFHVSDGARRILWSGLSTSSARSEG